MRTIGKMKLQMAVLFLVLGTAMCPAQDKFLEKYEVMDGVTVVSISPKMFQLMPDMETEGLDLGKLKGKITGLQIISTERQEIRNQMKADFSKMVDISLYEELMRVKDEESNVTFYVLQDGDLIKEMLMLADEPTEFTFICLSGSFTMQEIMQTVESMSDAD